MKKKFAKVAIVAAVLLGASAPVSAISICDVSPSTFEIWFIQQFYC